MIDAATRAAIQRELAKPDPVYATVLAEAALAAGESDALLYGLVAWRREAAGDFAGAFALLEQARALAPQDAEIATATGAVLRKAGRLGEAVAALDDAVALAPRFATAWLERGYAFHAAGQYDDAAESYHTAAKLDPRSAAAFAGFAQVAALLGYPVAVRNFAAKALALDPHEPTAICAVATVDIEAGAYASAVGSLRALLARSVPVDDRIGALALLGNALESMGADDDAFVAYREAKTAFARCHAAPPTLSHRELVESVDHAVAGVDPRKWQAESAVPSQPGAAAGHVFLLGYPRSGTSLVENILASADGVEALEERPTLAEGVRSFIQTPGGIARLAEADAATTQRLRAAYWAKVADSGADVAGKVFVDMDPFKGVQLPLIAKLFPAARVVVMRRDPRDVVWSCFRTQFAPSVVAHEFTSLERTAAHYDATMRLTENCLAVLPVDAHVLGYEELVADFDSVTRRLCAFIGIGWTPKLRSFAATARRRGVGTASVAQVRRGLFNGGGQWRRHARQLAPVLPVLDPWVRKFGFAP